MKKKCLMGWVVLLVSIVTTGQASRSDELTVIMVPREADVVRVGIDLATRIPTLLLNYKVGANGAVSLYGWTGSEWVNVSTDAFQQGQFFRAGPDSALIVEQEGRPLPESLIPPEAWCKAVYKITTTKIRPLLHLTGQYCDFSYKDWTWFSKSYHLPMESINPEGLNVAWYHKRLKEHLKKREMGSGDLQYWVPIRHPVETVPPVVDEQEQEFHDVDQKPEVELPSDPTLNPLAENAPMAVVFGAGDAEESSAEIEN